MLEIRREVILNEKDKAPLKMAFDVKRLSRDPNTQIGVCLTDYTRKPITSAYNGFPFRIDDSDPNRWLDRETKYKFILHAEARALLNAARIGISTNGGKLYLVGMGPPTMPCGECAKAIIQAGISEVIGCAYKPIPEHWGSHIDFGAVLLKEADIKFREVICKEEDLQ